MATNDFQPFAVGGSANVLTQSAYLARSELQAGVQSGQASSALYNKTSRQASIIAAMIGQFIVQETGQNATDDGTITTLLANFIAAIQASTRIKLTQTTNFYVNPSTGNDTNNGLSSAAPFKTLQGAAAALYDLYDFQSYGAVVNLANGNYTSTSGTPALTLASQPLGAFSQTPISFVGNPSSPGNVVISGINANSVQLQGGAGANFSGITFNSTGSGLLGGGLVADSGYANINGPCVFGNCGGGMMVALDSGTINVPGNVTINGNAAYALFGIENGKIFLPGSTMTVNGNPNFTVAFADFESNATFVQSGATINGNATGSKYRVVTGGSITVGSNNTGYFPGSIAGTIDPYSCYQ